MVRPGGGREQRFLWGSGVPGFSRGSRMCGRAAHEKMLLLFLLAITAYKKLLWLTVLSGAALAC